jgi:hypothetical protein
MISIVTCPEANSCMGITMDMSGMVKERLEKSMRTLRLRNILTGSRRGTSPSTTVASKTPFKPPMPMGMRTTPKTFA